MDRNKIKIVTTQRYFLPYAAETDWRGKEMSRLSKQEKGRKGINHIRRS